MASNTNSSKLVTVLGIGAAVLAIAVGSLIYLLI